MRTIGIDLRIQKVFIRADGDVIQMEIVSLQVCEAQLWHEQSIIKNDIIAIGIYGIRHQLICRLLRLSRGDITMQGL